MDRLGRAGAVGPLAVIVLFTLLDLAAGPERVVLSLVVIAPLLAASLTGRGLTIAYAVLAFVVAAVLGVDGQQYTADEWPSQAARLFGVALGGLFAVGACDARLEREARLERLSAEAMASRVRAEGAERTATLAEELQRTLLADPPRVPRLDVAVRYLPAAEHVRVGGDWYDAFETADGRTVLVIGDVAGHDGHAAVTMAQLRSSVRGIAQVLVRSPAELLTALDRAVRSLNPGTLATMVMAEVRADDRDRTDLLLRWANAGHPPPLLLRADGSARLLEHEPDLLLGVDPRIARADHELVLRPGDAVVMFTDGLVERRGAAIDDGLRRVVDTAAAVGGASLDALCDALLDPIGEHPSDDVALLAIRAQTALTRPPGP
ncbi:PP2C family protein-serine/threonine phosphatase [Pseudonocardia humida]|uniref:SpoIIE family protein phosphatase n=1 Tax=Pseudonocardia humida TaxID=2800819 RepID=A0ABT0ZTT0_9PSEU|nr:PP2C family protein-serine/threonine phosphatase [Pseudonocardia humida]MCO1654114.1 SpoIIE family protein phosphatase [Pseudonocardia humida]